MSPETTDLDWVAERLTDVPAPDDAVTDHARTMLMAHLDAARPVAAPVRRRRRVGLPSMRVQRRPLSLGLAAVAAAAGAFAIVNLESSGSHGPVAEASAGQLIVGKARAALSAAPGRAVSYTITDDAGDVWQDAQDSATPRDWVDSETVQGAPPIVVDGVEHGAREFYDPATDTIYRDGDTSDSFAMLDGPQLMKAIEGQGQTTVDTNAMFDGRPATTVTVTHPGGEVVELWVDPSQGDRPLQTTDTAPGGATDTQTWSNYQTVTAGASTPDPALLSSRFPSARVVTLDSSAFSAQENDAYAAAAATSGS